MQKPELLAPAGTLEKLKFALTYGADAVYLGGPQAGLRAYAGNFTMEEMKEGLAFAHARAAKVYVTVNFIPHNEDFIGLSDYLADLNDLGVDALIISDPGVLALAKEAAPNLDIHLSTQANVVNYHSARFWVEQGVTRLILARELSATEIAEIGRQVEAELEVFVHGAMCISYSGRCLLSNYLTGRDANRGACAQPCRYRYSLVEEERPGQYFPVFEDERGTYIMNSKDLCLLAELPGLLTLPNLAGLKIEGRMKSVHYVATVTKVYRQAIDRYFADPENYRPDESWLHELGKASHRGFTTGFYSDKPSSADHNYHGEHLGSEYDFVGIVTGYDQAQGRLLIEQRNNFRLGETLEVLEPTGEPWQLPVTALYDVEGQPIEVAPHAQMAVSLSGSRPAAPWALLRRARK